MAELLGNMADIINDEELLRRYFFSSHYDKEQDEWSYNTFQLRDLTPPENYLSVTREKIAPDAIAHAKNTFPYKKLMKLKGYTVIQALAVRKINIEKIKLQVLADIKSIDGHAGIYTWHDDRLVEGSVEEPEILELKKTLFNIAIPTYKAFPEKSF